MIVNFCNDTGITDLGDNRIKQKCMEITIQYFGRLSLDDIYRAFDMVIIGRLESPGEHYGRLTPQHIATVLWRYQSLILKKTPIQHDQSRDPDRITKMKEFLDQELLSYKATGQLSIRNYNNVYDFMQDHSMFTLSDGLLEEINKVVLARHFPEERSVSNNSAIGKIISKINNIQNIDKKKFAYYVRRQAVIEQFKIWENEKNR